MGSCLDSGKSDYSQIDMFGYSQVPFDLFDSQTGSNSNYSNHSPIHHFRVEQSKEGSADPSVEPEEKLLETNSSIGLKPGQQTEERTYSVETVHSENQFVQAGRY